MFHFLHGNNEFNSENAASQWSSTYGYQSDSEVPLGDIFYGEELEFYTMANNITDRMKAAVYRSWRRERPSELLSCSALGQIDSAISGT